MDESISTEEGFEQFSSGLLNASNGDASYFADPWFPGPSHSTGYYQNFVVGCSDWAPSADDYHSIEEVHNMLSALNPRTKGFTQFFSYFGRCVNWGVANTYKQQPLGRIPAEAAANILIVNAFYDPETNVQGAVDIREQIPGSHIIFRNGSGHTSFFKGGETGEAAIGFVLNGTLPEDGAVYST